MKDMRAEFELTDFFIDLPEEMKIHKHGKYINSTLNGEFELFCLGYQAALTASAKQIIQDDIAKGMFAQWSRNAISGNGKESAVPAQEPVGEVQHYAAPANLPAYVNMKWYGKPPKNGTKLYTAPVKQDELKAKLCTNMIRYLGSTKTQAKAIVDGVFDGEHTINQADLEPVKQESWMPIETAPKNTKVIVRYKNICGKDRTVFAKYLDKFTEEATAGTDCETDYCEADDTFYCKEGWVELIDNWDEFSSVYFDSRNVPTHWMQRPPAPEGE